MVHGVARKLGYVGLAEPKVEVLKLAKVLDPKPGLLAKEPKDGVKLRVGALAPNGRIRDSLVVVDPKAGTRVLSKVEVVLSPKPKGTVLTGGLLVVILEMNWCAGSTDVA